MAKKEADVLQFTGKSVEEVRQERLEELRRQAESRAKVNRVYDSFLSLHRKNSDRTADEYRYRVEEFFQMVLGRELKFLTIEEIQSIEKADVQTKFIDTLTERGNSNNTIQVKLNSVRSFYNELLSNNIQVNPVILKTKLPKDVKHHESLSFEELDKLYDFCMNEKELGLEKMLLMKFLYVTANRKSATFEVTWNNFIKQKDIVTGDIIDVIRLKDKGNKWNEIPISKEFYEELQQLNNGQEKVFNLSTKTVERMLKRFSEAIGKEISIHSLKATSVTLGYSLSGKDINLVKQHAKHKSIRTTEIYLREEKSLVNQISYNVSREVDVEIVNKVSHEELLDFINENDDIKKIIAMRWGN